jgi:hypothetical protein
VQRAAPVLAILAVALASTSLVQGGGSNQGAHLALVRALSHGTPVIDRYRGETLDLARHDDHLYSAKAPGVALLAVGPYFALDRSGVLGELARRFGSSRYNADLWALTVVVCSLAALLTLVLVSRLGDVVAPGNGVLAAVTLGMATLFLPFSTLLFAHVPAAALAFAAFAILWRRRGSLATAAAGTLAGLAVTVEYPLGIAAVGLGFYAIARGEALRRGLTYGTGLAVGVSPLLVYNWWAFGSPLHFPYEDALPITGVAANEQGFFGISWPSLDTAAQLLLDERGLVVIMPVVLCGVAALVPLSRSHRHEALLIGGLGLAFLVYNAGYDVPFGGDSPGPRFLIATLPFLGVPLALSYATWPWVTLSLALPSAVYAVGVTLTGPLGRRSGWDWITSASDTVHATTGEVALFLLLLTVAAALAGRTARFPNPTRRDAGAVLAALATWSVAVVAVSGVPTLPL